MAIRSYNSAEVKNDLYGRLVTGTEETNLLLGDTTRGDMSPTGYYGDSTSSANDNYPDVIKPTSQSGNGRWIKMFGTVPIGGLLMWPTNTAPGGWQLCDGTALSRTVYAQLFGIIGTTYGVGDGSTTFNVPDLRQRLPLGKAASGTGSTLGSSGGAIDHVHSIDPPNTTTGAPSAVVNNISLVGIGTAASDTHTHDVNIAAFDSAAANPPYLVVNFIIKL